MTILVSPPSFVMQSSEELPLGFDATALLLSGQTVSSPTTVLTDLTTSTTITLANAPTVSGNIVTQVVVGSQLTADHVYRLVVTFTAGTDTTWSMPLQISCPF